MVYRSDACRSRTWGHCDARTGTTQFWSHEWSKHGPYTPIYGPALQVLAGIEQVEPGLELQGGQEVAVKRRSKNKTHGFCLTLFLAKWARPRHVYPSGTKLVNFSKIAMGI
jgi:hypothetical protein